MNNSLLQDLKFKGREKNALMTTLNLTTQGKSMRSPYGNGAKAVLRGEIIAYASLQRTS